MQEPEPSAPTLHRVLSPFGVMLLTLSALSPVASVYVGGGAVLHLAGTGAAIGYILGGVISIVLALLYAELASAFPRSGGPYPAVVATLGRASGFAYVVVNVLLTPAFMGFTALGFADYVRVLIPALPHLPTAVVGLAIACWLASLRVRTSERVTGLFLGIEGAALVLLTAVAVLHPTRSLVQVMLHPVMLDHGVVRPTSLATVALGVITGAWSTAGASWAAYFGEELKDAERTIGRVVSWAAVVASLTIATPVVLMVLSAPDLKTVMGAEAPMAAYLSMTATPLIATLVSLGVVAALFNNLIAAAMANARFLYSTGRDGFWAPSVNRFLARLSGRLRTPVMAMLALLATTAVSALFGEEKLAVLLAADITALLLPLAVWVGRRKALTGRWFRAPLHPFVPIFGLGLAIVSIYVNWLDPDQGRPCLILMAALFIGALAAYAVYLRHHADGWRDGALEAPAE